MRRAIEAAMAELGLPSTSEDVAAFIEKYMPERAAKRKELVTKALKEATERVSESVPVLPTAEVALDARGRPDRSGFDQARGAVGAPCAGSTGLVRAWNPRATVARPGGRDAHLRGASGQRRDSSSGGGKAFPRGALRSSEPRAAVTILHALPSAGRADRLDPDRREPARGDAAPSASPPPALALVASAAPALSSSSAPLAALSAAAPASSAVADAAPSASSKLRCTRLRLPREPHHPSTGAPLPAFSALPEPELPTIANTPRGAPTGTTTEPKARFASGQATATKSRRKAFPGISPPSRTLAAVPRQADDSDEELKRLVEEAPGASAGEALVYIQDEKEARRAWPPGSSSELAEGVLHSKSSMVRPKADRRLFHEQARSLSWRRLRRLRHVDGHTRGARLGAGWIELGAKGGSAPIPWGTGRRTRSALG